MENDCLIIFYAFVLVFEDVLYYNNCVDKYLSMYFMCD